jgi:hypothetical protein
MKGCMPDALATGASAMVISGAALPAHNEADRKAEQGQRGDEQGGRRQQAASVGGDQSVIQ